jgi:hypothetical protein
MSMLLPQSSLSFYHLILVACYGFFLFICFVVYAVPFYVYVFDTWSLVAIALDI